VPLVVQAYEYFLHQIFSLMRTEAHANETRRKRSTQGRRKFFEHALIYDGFAAPLGAHGLCPALLSLFHGHLLGTHCPSHEKCGSQPREPVAESCILPKDVSERIVMLSRRDGAMKMSPIDALMHQAQTRPKSAAFVFKEVWTYDSLSTPTHADR
jgi:hypothetical protein